MAVVWHLHLLKVATTIHIATMYSKVAKLCSKSQDYIRTWNVYT